MQTMDASLAGLVRAGTITMAVAETRSSSPDELRRLVEAGGAFNHASAEFEATVGV
jgi:twitching motility protein PilT